MNPKLMVISNQSSPVTCHFLDVCWAALSHFTNHSAVFSTAVQSQKALLYVDCGNKHGSLQTTTKVVVNSKGFHKNTVDMLSLTIKEVSTSISLIFELTSSCL